MIKLTMQEREELVRLQKKAMWHRYSHRRPGDEENDCGRCKHAFETGGGVYCGRGVEEFKTGSDYVCNGFAPKN